MIRRYDKVSAYPPVMVRAFRLMRMAEGFKLCSLETQRYLAKTEPWFYAEIKSAMMNSIYGKMAQSKGLK